MSLRELADHLGAKNLTPALSLDVPVTRAWSGDRMSDLISEAQPGTLLVTNLDGAQLLRVAELMDVAAICFSASATPRPETIAAAQEQGTVLLASPAPLFETCGLLYEALRQA